MTVYIVGYRGYIGRTLYEHLKEREYDVRGIGAGTPMPMGFKFSDVIVNCACRGWKDGDEDPADVVESNIMLPMRLQKLRNGAVMIHLSSGIELIQPGHFYAKTKGVASDYLRNKAHVLYLYTIFGGKYIQMNRFMNTMITACAKNEPFTIHTPMHTRDFVHIDHLVNMIESLLNDRTYKTIHVGTGRAVSFIEAYRLLVGVVGHEFDNVDIDTSDLSMFNYCSPQKTAPLTLAKDMQGEWEVANGAI